MKRFLRHGRRAVRGVAGCVFLCALVGASTARAQPAPAPPVVPVTLEDALARSAARAPDTLAALARETVAETEVGVARMFPNPSVHMAALTNPSRLQGGVTFTLPILGQRGAAIDVAEAGVVATRWDVVRTRLDVRLATATAWLELWLAEREAATSRDNAGRRQRLLSVAQDRYAAGSAPQLDVLRARAEAARARADLVVSELAVTGRARRLGVWLGVGQDRASWLRTTGEAPDAPPLPPLPALVARLDQHPLLAGSRARATEARRNVSLEQRLRLPVVGLDLGVDEWATSPQTPPSLVVGLSMEVPFFHNRGALIRRAEANVIARDVERSAARARLEAELSAVYADVEGAALRARVEALEVLPAAQQAADLAVEGYGAGRGDIQTVIAAEQALTDARLAVARAAAARGLALARLENALGSAP